eukprot:598970-Pelagomonas_calceolata.AAC.14
MAGTKGSVGFGSLGMGLARLACDLTFVGGCARSCVAQNPCLNLRFLMPSFNTCFCSNTTSGTLHQRRAAQTFAK